MQQFRNRLSALQVTKNKKGVRKQVVQEGVRLKGGYIFPNSSSYHREIIYYINFLFVILMQWQM